MANTYDTSGLPLGTTSPKALYNNTSNLDDLMIGPNPRYPDRKNQLRWSWAGIESTFTTGMTAFENSFNQFLISSGYEPTHLVYVDGSPLTVLRATQLIDRAGLVYRVKMPATFPVALTGTWATDSSALVEVTDSVLRQDLANAGGDPSKGAVMLGFAPTGIGATPTTVQAALDQFNQKYTGQHYSTYGAKVNRVSDRLFIGNAINHDGGIAMDQPDWFTTAMRAEGREYAFITSSTVAITNSLNNNASNTALIASHTKDLLPGWNAIGLIAIGYGNATSGTGHAYAIYAEAYRTAGVSGGAYGMEIDTINRASLTGIDPYIQNANQVIGLQIAAGGEYSSVGQFDATAAINIRRNGARFYRGIVFGSDSLTGTDGTGTGSAIAIAMARGHQIQWFCGVDQGGPSLYSTCGLAANTINQEFGDSFIRYHNASGGLVFELENAAGGVNHLSLKSQAFGLPAQVLAKGTSTDVDIQLVPKGTGGRIWTGPFTAGAGTVAGWVEMKDDAGVTRKFAILS